MCTQRFEGPQRTFQSFQCRCYTDIIDKAASIQAQLAEEWRNAVSPQRLRRNASRYAAFIVAGALLQPMFGQARPPEKEDELKAFFQHTEQSLVDSIALGDKSPWINILD